MYMKIVHFSLTSRPEIYEKLTRHVVWRDKSENEMFLNNYLRHPAYETSCCRSILGTANDYCRWRTDRVNERILIGAVSYGSTHPDEAN